MVSFRERLSKLFSPQKSIVIEDQHWNPMKWIINTRVNISLEQYYGQDFLVKEVRENTEIIDDQKSVFTDYMLVNGPCGDSQLHLRLRAMPLIEKKDDRDFCLILMELADEQEFDEDLMASLKDSESDFLIIQKDDEESVQYDRLPSGSWEPHIVSLKSMFDKDGDGRVKQDEVGQEKIQYWAYSREAGETVEYLFVELNVTNGWFQTWKGIELDPVFLK